jgi:mRNA-degrading endonuclease toxin of MazEF toxin-antitoxin module
VLDQIRTVERSRLVNNLSRIDAATTRLVQKVQQKMLAR